ncbi:ROK family protein [Parapedobacter koreensis]|uniref:ROK family protein (Putative glucokinase) n=1 Tax=Parapedobacter koreensis TaxID=332977 RepID=A0A1H7S5N1_9SPHI|nr:ROK family protein [Parapedobacter koreensis]SEL67961.1 ROK family protein (putative glucokinase) [Parapedobacter koreensis]
MKYDRQDQLKQSVFKLLYYNDTLSLAELSTYTKKSVPNITSIINGLVKEGYAVEHGLAPSTGGRRPVKYRLNPKKKQYILAVAMDQFVSRIVAYNLANEAIHAETSITLPLQDNDHAFEQLCQFINSYINEAGIKHEHILGIGIGMPGFIDVEKGINASFLLTENGELGLRDKLSRSLGLPVYIENDSSVIAISELHFGAAKGLKDVMVVNMGWGIGLGMIVNGSLFRGHNGYAGEFSHIPLSHTNKLCSCGKRGCLEVDASLLVAVENAKQAMAEGATSSLHKSFAEEGKAEGDLLIEAAQSGDQLAVSTLSDAAFMVGKGIATLIHIMNPERVVLSGRGAAAGKLLLAPVQQAINEFCIPKLAEQTNIAISGLGYHAELLGAASLVIENCVLHRKEKGELDTLNS